MKALDDSDVVVPKQGSQRILIIVIGFSKKAGEVCQPWGKHLSTDYLQDSHATYYQIAHLEGAPSFVRPMILRGMRKSLPPQEQAHFVPLYDNQEAWKKAVQFSDPDTAYIIVAQPQGKTRGSSTELIPTPKTRISRKSCPTSHRNRLLLIPIPRQSLRNS